VSGFDGFYHFLFHVTEIIIILIMKLVNIHKHPLF